MNNEGIRVAIGQFHDLTDEKLRFAAQIGVKGVQMNNPRLPGEASWEYKDIKALVDRTKKHGLVFEAIENVPTHFYNKIMLGLPGRDEQIANMQKTIRNIGRAGVPIWGFHWMPNSVWRTERLAPARGGAGATKFDMAEIEGKSKKQLRKYLPTTLGHSMPIYDEKDGIVTTWEVQKVVHRPKSNGIDTSVFVGRSGPRKLYLITCGGAFDAADANYLDNIYVEAVPLQGLTPSPTD